MHIFIDIFVRISTLFYIGLIKHALFVELNVKFKGN